MTEGTIQIPEGKVGFDDETPTGGKNTKTKANKNKLLRISVCEMQRRKVENKVLQTPFLFIAMIFLFMAQSIILPPEGELDFEDDTTTRKKMKLN